VQEGLPVHAVRSHRRPTQSKTKIGWTLGALVGVLATGAVVAPGAFAATSTTTTLGPARSVAAGQSTNLTGYVKSGSKPLGYVNTQLQSSIGKGWVNGPVSHTWSTGSVTFTVKPSKTTYYRLVFRGQGVHSASASGMVRVTVTDSGSAVVRTAASLAGAPYQYGAAGPRAFDCSGYTKYVFARHGRTLPHNAAAQARYGVAVAKSAARPGDLLVFNGGSHAAIYAGGGQMWDASVAGKPVARKKIWSNSYVVRRVV
jgi:cell wall-associated NlpC family hydrolase